MKKLVAAIIAVIGVHIGFAMIVTTEPAADEAAAAVRSLPQTDKVRIARIPEISDDADIAASTEVAAIAVNTPPRSILSVDRPAATAARGEFPSRDRSISRKAPRPANRTVPLFEPVTITPGSMPIAADIGDARTIRVENTKFTEKRPKRSLIAKALPIIKKPWDWLKFVGSRLK